jgi:tRNA (uracil-5-)-methyltransferase TRM9
MLSVKESYDIIAKEFAVTRVFTWKWTDDFFNNIPNHSCVLDIGCGNGRNCTYPNIYITGIDISFNQIKNNKTKEQHYLQCNMIEMPFKNNSFDFIICIASFHHLSTINERYKCLLEMKRLLSNNEKSRILLSVWSIHQPKKTRRKFTNYGDNIIYWKTVPRYYYIFELSEIITLLQTYFNIEKYFWDCGNEIFILQHFST